MRPPMTELAAKVMRNDKKRFDEQAKRRNQIRWKKPFPPVSAHETTQGATQHPKPSPRLSNAQQTASHESRGPSKRT